MATQSPGFAQANGFSKYAVLEYDDDAGHAIFGPPEPGFDGHGYVYIWVEEDKYYVVYVGMAGTTMEARCGQHENGFTNSDAGRKHSGRVFDGVSQGKHYAVYGKESGDPHTDECKYYLRFRPTWNAVSPC